jgi:hypothetical protein
MRTEVQELQEFRSCRIQSLRSENDESRLQPSTNVKFLTLEAGEFRRSILQLLNSCNS